MPEYILFFVEVPLHCFGCVCLLILILGELPSWNNHEKHNRERLPQGTTSVKRRPSTIPTRNIHFALASIDKITMHTPPHHPISSHLSPNNGLLLGTKGLMRAVAVLFLFHITQHHILISITEGS